GACPDCQHALKGLVGSLPGTVADLSGQTAAEPTPALPGYETVARIDAGGMGDVWRVRDLQFRRSLAIKVMKSWAASAPRLGERFVAEAQICGQLAHPSIVPVHAMGQLPDGRPYYTMKLVEGRTLAALLAGGRQGGDPGRPGAAERRMEFVQVFHQVCQAL